MKVESFFLYLLFTKIMLYFLKGEVSLRRLSWRWIVYVYTAPPLEAIVEVPCALLLPYSTRNRNVDKKNRSLWSNHETHHAHNILFGCIDISIILLTFKRAFEWKENWFPMNWFFWFGLVFGSNYATGTLWAFKNSSSKLLMCIV